MAYVYRHIRLDKNIPFYIGIGSDDNYSRANAKVGRNRYWKNIISKSAYEVEIIFDEINWDDACKKEIEFIALYKRNKDGGSLTNITLGGEGQLGLVPWNAGLETPIETRKKQSLKRMGFPSPIKGTKRPQHVIDAVRKACTGKPSWNKGISPSQESIDKRKKSMDGKWLKGINHPMFGTKMSPHVKEKLRIANENRPAWNKGKSGYKMVANHNKKQVIQNDLFGNFIKEYASVCEVQEHTKFNKGNISNACSGKQKTAYGFRWCYKKSAG
jgi:hypothetical protein